MSSREKRKQEQLKPQKMNVDYSLLDEAMRKMGATPDTRPLPKPKPTPAVQLRKLKLGSGGAVRGMGAATKGGNFTRNG